MSFTNEQNNCIEALNKEVEKWTNKRDKDYIDWKVSCFGSQKECALKTNMSRLSQQIRDDYFNLYNTCYEYFLEENQYENEIAQRRE